MRVCALIAALLGLGLVSASPAAADPPSAAVRAYSAGHFLAAADLAEERQSSDSLTFAARALMAECVVSADPDAIEALAARAEMAARRALALDENSVEARLHYAIALGVRGRQASLGEAWARGYAQRGHRLIEEALELDPNNAWAHALLGGWNLEVVRRGGRAGAIALGAREARGLAEFERARELAPDDPMIALHYAIALIELDAARFSQRADNLLSAAQGETPQDAFERRALARAALVQQALREEGPRGAARQARILFP